MKPDGALIQLMSDLSERCWCAGWLDGMENTLWSFVLRRRNGESGPFCWGMGDVTGDEVCQLEELSRAAGGWGVWSDYYPSCGANVVTMEAWRLAYEDPGPVVCHGLCENHGAT